MDNPNQNQPQSGAPQQGQSGMQQPPPPFACTFSPNLPELLQQMNSSIAISTYQAGKVILISPKNRDELIQLPRNFAKPMGIAVKGKNMVFALRDEVLILSNSPGLAEKYPKQPGVYDAFFTPRQSFYCGAVDMHDIEWGKDELIGVNTRFSCLVRLSKEYSFEPFWQPPFISELLPEDRCHLNGVAMQDGKPKYVTALGKSDTAAGWRERKANGGIVMDVETGEIILENLSMPHSPKIYDGQLYVLLSGTGELIRVDVENKKYDILKSMEGFVRGMDRYGDYLFIGLSKLRTTSKAFQELPVSQKSVFAGVMVLYMPTFSSVGYIKYESSVDEIYDVTIIPDTVRPGLLNNSKPEFRMVLSYPGKDIWVASPEDQQPKGSQ